jgi:hypothetical protein
MRAQAKVIAQHQIEFRRFQRNHCKHSASAAGFSGELRRRRRRFNGQEGGLRTRRSYAGSSHRSLGHTKVSKSVACNPRLQVQTDSQRRRAPPLGEWLARIVCKRQGNGEPASAQLNVGHLATQSTLRTAGFALDHCFFLSHHQVTSEWQ